MKTKPKFKAGDIVTNGTQIVLVEEAFGSCYVLRDSIRKGGLFMTFAEPPADAVKVGVL